MEDLRLHQEEEEEKSEHIEMSRRTWSNVSSLTDQSATERQFFNTFTDDVVVKIVELKKKYPWMYPWQIRKRLYQDLDFITKPLPSVAGVEWILRVLSNCEQNMSNVSTQDSSSLMINNTQQFVSVDSRNPSEQRAPSEPSIIHSNNINLLLKGKNRILNGKITKKARRQRVNFTTEEIQILQKEFQRSHYPDHGLIAKLAKSLNSEVYRIQVWFANRRAKQRRLTKDIQPNNESRSSFLFPSSSPTSSRTELETSFHSFSSNDSDQIDMPEQISSLSINVSNSTVNYPSVENYMSHELSLSYLPKFVTPQFFTDSLSSCQLRTRASPIHYYSE